MVLDICEHLSKKDKELIIKFKNDCFLERLGKPRVIRYLGLVCYISKWLAKPLNKANKEDLIRIVQHIENQDYTAWTKQTYRVGIKKFWKRCLNSAEN